MLVGRIESLPRWDICITRNPKFRGELDGSRHSRTLGWRCGDSAVKSGQYLALDYSGIDSRLKRLLCWAGYVKTLAKNTRLGTYASSSSSEEIITGRVLLLFFTAGGKDWGSEDPELEEDTD